MDDNGTITEDDEVQVVDTVDECPETRVSHPSDDNAWTLFYTGHTLLDSNAFDFLFPELCCSSCCMMGKGLPVSIGQDDNYNHCITYETCWFEQDLVRSSALLASHGSHIPGVQVFNMATPGQKLLPGQCKSLPSKVSQVVSIFFGADHFITAVINLKKHCIFVHDGLQYNIKN